MRCVRRPLLFVLLAVLLPAGPASAEHGQADNQVKMSHLSNIEPSGATNSDLAFWKELAFAGNYRGFRIIDISNEHDPEVLADVRCNGAQGDVGVYGDDEKNLLAFQSVDNRQVNADNPALATGQCNSTNDQTNTGWEGVRIFDVSDPRKPFFVKAIPTDCGSHTHTVVPDPKNDRVLIYVSSYR